MDKKHLEAYYPEGITMEDRLFKLGGRLTSSGIGTWPAMIAIGIVVALIGLVISSNAEIGMVVFGIGDLLAAIGIFGISRYNYGLRCLERAELLYNTRCAFGQKPEVEESKKPVVKNEKVKIKKQEPYGTELPEEQTEFIDSVLKTSTDDLKLILRDQRELYSEAELHIMEEVLEKRLSR